MAQPYARPEVRTCSIGTTVREEVAHGNQPAPIHLTGRLGVGYTADATHGCSRLPTAGRAQRFDSLEAQRHTRNNPTELPAGVPGNLRHEFDLHSHTLTQPFP